MKILKFYSKFQPSCEKLDQLLSSIEHEAIEVSENSDLVDKYTVTSVPTFIKVDDEDNEISRTHDLISDIKK